MLSLHSTTLIALGMVNFFYNKNLSSDFLLLSGRQRRAFSERLNIYSKRELEVRLCRSRPRVPEERYDIMLNGL